MDTIKEFFEDLWDSIRGYYNYLFRYIPRQIATVFSYLPIVWKDHDWDEYYLFVLMHKKLGRMEKEIRNGRFTTFKETARDICIAKTLCKRLSDDKYDERAYKSCGNLWKNRMIESSSGNILFRPIDHKSREYRKFRRDIESAAKIKKEDLKLLGKLIERKSSMWWD